MQIASQHIRTQRAFSTVCRSPPPDYIHPFLLHNHALTQVKEKSVPMLLSIFARCYRNGSPVPVICRSQPEKILSNATLKSAFDVGVPLGINTPSRFLIALCLLMIGAFLFKAVFGLLVNLFQTRFSYSVAHRLSGQMWSYHFSQSLERMRGTNSGRILTEINVWPIHFANAFMVGGLLLINEICVISLIALGLLFYNSVVFLSIASLIGGGAIVIRRATKETLGVQQHSTTAGASLQHPQTMPSADFLRSLSPASDTVREAYLGTDGQSSDWTAIPAY